LVNRSQASVMKEYKDEKGNLIREFDFNDWKKGKKFENWLYPGKEDIETGNGLQLVYRMI